MSNFRNFILIILLVVPLVIGVGYWLREHHLYESTDDAYLHSNIVLISPRVQGYVNVVNISENQVVKQGDVLITIEDNDYLARVNQAEANVNEETAHIARLKTIKISQLARIKSAEANIEQARAKQEQTQKDLQRFTTLINQGSATRQAVDKIQSESKQSSAELKSSEAIASAEQSQLTNLDLEISETEARLKNAQALLSLAKIDLEHTRIKAPFDGVIGKRGVQLGAYIRPGVALAALVQNNNIWIEANFKETQLQNIQVGQPVIIKIDAYPDHKFTGLVDSFSPASGSEFSLLPEENATGNFTKIVRRIPVKIVFNSSEQLKLLKPGLSAMVKVKVH